MTQKNARSRNRLPEKVNIKKLRLTGGMQQIADVYREGKELDKLYDRMLKSSEGLPPVQEAPMPATTAEY